MVLPHPSSRDFAQLVAVLHVAGVQPQTFDTQGPFAQSVSAAHFNPGAHFGHVPPPQSLSVSPPFEMPSVHDGPAMHALAVFE